MKNKTAGILALSAMTMAFNLQTSPAAAPAEGILVFEEPVILSFTKADHCVNEKAEQVLKEKLDGGAESYMVHGDELEAIKTECRKLGELKTYADLKGIIRDKLYPVPAP